ncbi:MAG: metallophosphoesterase [Crenarchaeota archaeon]|nr:metallophosphoesterase [Thermoproteota archaeon]MDW8034002.1 metallophosphoesterase [Nitrososphaerota archaeon]
MDLEEALERFDKLGKEETVNLCEETYEVFQKEPPILRLKFEKILVIGDLHGDLESCVNAITHLERLDEAGIVFLGDYIDRGPYQSGVINLLLNEKKNNPDRIFLLRGNHETPLMNFSYGFIDILIKRFKKEYEEVYNAYLKIFSEMPFVALFKDKVILVHGGLARNVRRVKELEEAGKGGVEPQDTRIFETIWNDPSEEVEEFAPNPRGPRVYFFGKNALRRFLKENGLKMMVRSHEPMFRGYRVLFEGDLINVFSCRFYGIEPAALELEDEKYSFISLD